MMSKILRVVACVIFGMVAIWMLFWWKTHPVTALVGGFCLLTSYAFVLALQFLTIFKVNQRDPSPRATLLQLCSAWWAEVVLGIRVFMWQQAFQEHKFENDIFGGNQKGPLDSRPDHVLDASDLPLKVVETNTFAKKQRGVLFIHGFLCNRGFWNPWLQRLEKTKSPFMAISLEPVFTSIDHYAALIESAVQQLTTATRQPPLLICHSMGGLAARAWLRLDPTNAQKVSHIVTIGTPHHGTSIVHGPSFAENATQMQKDSEWITQLMRDEQPQGGPLSHLPGTAAPKLLANPGVYAQFTCYYSNCDNIVFPTRTATLEGADNRFVPGQAHIQMAFDEAVMRESLARL